MNVISSISVCKYCNKTINFKITKRLGLAFSCEFSCAGCDSKKLGSYDNSSKMCANSGNNEKLSPLYDINIRLVYGMRAIGKGHSAATTLCGILNLHSPPSKFSKYIEVLGSAVEDICFETMKEAVEDAVTVNEGSRDLSVATDGTWQKRGHTSLNGVITATSVDTGKVIDVAILSKHCHCKNKFDGQHEDKCSANFQGVSGGMEVAGAKQIFERSLPVNGVRYLQYLGDGDSKGYQSIIEAHPYGEDCKVSKLERIGHVQKRMGTRLRTLKFKHGKTKLRDGKTLGGRNRLTDAAILAIQKYCGLAI